MSNNAIILQKTNTKNGWAALLLLSLKINKYQLVLFAFCLMSVWLMITEVAIGDRCELSMCVCVCDESETIV